MPRRLLHRARREDENAAALALREVRQAETHEPHERSEQKLDRLLNALRCDRRRRARRRAAAVPDQDVQTAERLDRPLDDGTQVARVPDVASDCERTDAVGLALEHLPPAR